MFKILGALLSVSVIAGFSVMASAQPAAGLLVADGASTSPISKDICWQPDVKKSFKKDTLDLLGQLFVAVKDSGMGKDAVVRDVVTSPIHMSADNFASKSIDVAADHAVCSASMTVTIKSRRHGTVVVADQVLEFQIEHEESGRVVVVNMSDLTDFEQALGNQIDAAR